MRLIRCSRDTVFPLPHCTIHDMKYLSRSGRGLLGPHVAACAMINRKLSSLLKNEQHVNTSKADSPGDEAPSDCNDDAGNDEAAAGNLRSSREHCSNFDIDGRPQCSSRGAPFLNTDLTFRDYGLEPGFREWQAKQMLQVSRSVVVAVQPLFTGMQHLSLN